MKDIVKGDRQSLVSYVMAEAAKSNVEKRKVGCVIIDVARNEIVAAGHNGEHVHAEIVALSKFKDEGGDYQLYVSHPPCPACAKAILEAGFNNFEVVQEFMKFDGDKLRYDLIPPSTTKALAEVLTFGARKYKPNNWKNVSPEELHRYKGAAMRHFEAYRAGEYLDPESGMPHLWHCLTNLSFLIELDVPNEADIKPKNLLT